MLPLLLPLLLLFGGVKTGSTTVPSLVAPLPSHLRLLLKSRKVSRNCAGDTLMAPSVLRFVKSPRGR